MKLRWKFFLVLLLASLVPMATVMTISQKACRKLGQSISNQVYNVLTDTAKKEIVEAAENYALISQRGKIAIEFALLMMVKEIEKNIIFAPPLSSAIYFAKDFDQDDSAPPDLAPSGIHQKLAQNGTQSAKPVSFQHPNFLLAPGVTQDRVTKDIARLTKLSPTLKYISQQFGPTVFWVYASLKSGVHISYPGHGGYPKGYDPRLRPWYLNAKKSNGLIWSPPIMDATTNQLTFTLSAPFFNPDGTFKGVAAIDVLIPKVLLNNEVSSQWSKDMRSFMVSREPGNGDGTDALWVLAHGQTENPTASAGHQQDSINLEQQAEFAELVRQFKKKPSGFIEMAYQGADSFWAFANIFPNLYFVIVVPKATVMELPETVSKMFLGYIQNIKNISFMVVAVVLVLVAGIAFFLSRSSSKHVMESVNAFERLAKGDFSVRIGHRFYDERDLLHTTFNTIVPKLEEHLRMRNALFVAQEVQQSLLPTENPTLSGFDIAGLSIYCDETGGDYFDFIPTNNKCLAVVVGDVSGHGVSSALLMATARALVMLRASMPGPAAKIINDVNRHLSMDTSHTGNFMTFFYCELTPNQRGVRWVRAGHDPALIYDPETDTFGELKGKGCALGLDYALEYEEFQHTLSPKQIVLIGTDGIWEMQNEDGKMFGKQRVKNIIRDNALTSAEEILTSITLSLARFRGRQEPEDDITMVVIKVDQPDK
jgi:phosphoserine phosphatase RsbU/P